VTDEMLERAKENLREELVFFGLTERFDESLVLAKRRLGFRAILYRSEARVNDNRPRGDTVPDELAQAAERCNLYDIELYRYATELFEKAPELDELEFQVDLEALRAARAEGEITLDRPVPAGFGGDQEAWRMVLEARATSHRLEFEIGRNGARAARERTKARNLQRKIERWGADPPSIEKLEEEVERLRSAASRVEELEQEVERLRTATAPPAQVPGRNGPRRRRGRTKERQKRGSSAPARSRPRRNTKRTGARPAEDRPERDGKRTGAKRGRRTGVQQRGTRRRANSEQTVSDG